MQAIALAVQPAAVGFLLLLGSVAFASDDPTMAAHAALDARRDELEVCFRGNVAAAMGFHGVLTVRLTVASDGKVTTSKLVRGTGLPRYRDLRVVQHLKNMQLPRGTPPLLVHRFEWRHAMPFPEPDPPDGGL